MILPPNRCGVNSESTSFQEVEPSELPNSKAFRKWAKAGFVADLIPLIPPGAKLSAASSVKSAMVGKVPGKLLPDGEWCGFTDFTNHYATAGDIMTWDTWNGAGVGLIGRNNPAVDIDIIDPLLADKVRTLAIEKLGPAPCRTGNAPKCLLLYRGRLEKKLRLVLEKNGEVQVVECLGARGHYVVEGIHPKTDKPYSWDTDPTDFSLCLVNQTDLVSFLNAVAELAAADGWTVRTSSGGGAYACQPAPDGFEPNTDRIINRLTMVLQTIAPAIEGNGGDEYTVKHVAMLCGDHGVTEDVAIELLLDHWNPRCEPPWDEEELRGKVHRAYQARADDIGSRAIEEEIPWLWQAMAARDPSLMPTNEVIGYEPCSVHRDAVACLKEGGCDEAPILAGSEKGKAILQELIEKCGGVAPEAETDNKEAKDPQTKAGPRVKLLKGGKCKVRKVHWLWDGWLAQGKFHILAGPKGAGKSTLGYSLMATISVGGIWPDRTQAPLGDAVVWSAEDDFEDTILPRFLAAGGDRDRLYHIGPVEEGSTQRPFDLSRDVSLLRETVRQLPNLKIIMVDPVVMAVAGDSHKNAETRRGLQPLVDLAEQCRAALIGVTHFTKGTEGKDPVERVTGSLAFGALARVVLAAVAGEDGKHRRLVRASSNIGPSGGGFEYLLLQEPLLEYDLSAQRVMWGATLQGAAKALLEDIRTRSARLRAVEFILDLLKQGPIDVADIKRAAEANGHSWRTVERAKADLLYIAAKEVPALEWGKPKRWQWVNTAT
jgi:hypothetical protein